MARKTRKPAVEVTRADRVAEIVKRATRTHKTDCADDAFDAALVNVDAYWPEATDEEGQAAGVEDAIDALNSGACICHKV